MQYLVNFNVHMPDLYLKQEDTVKWLTKYLPDEYSKYIQRFCVSEKSIESRYLFSETGIGDFEDSNENMYSFKEDEQPNLSTRAIIAQTAVEKIFKDVYKDSQESPSHLIHVSCTHYQSPSGAQILVADKNWNNKTTVTHAYHMGCYASLPAIRIARGYNAAGAGSVDIVHTELCSFHLDKTDCTPEQVIMKTLFSDGAIKYSSLNEEVFIKSGRNGFQVLGLHEEILPDSTAEMTWKLSPACFSMSLSRKVPKLLSEVITKYMEKLFEVSGFDYDKDKKDFCFAIHPGGPKIVELVQEVLALTDDQIKYSKKILSTRGNMSSATLPHVWDQILLNESKQYVCSVAFGPGLTITGAIFKICKQ
jgi:predicted naringenin-chalcone synthase